MSIMKAAVLEKAPGGMRIEEIPVPAPLEGEVLVKVHACGVCHTDLHVIKAEVAFPTPAVLGHEISGTIVELGKGVAGPAVGTKVVSAFIMPCGRCRPCAIGRDDLCDNFFAMNRLRGVLYDGTSRLRRADGTPIAMYSMAGLAEYAVVPATDVFPLPDALPLAESSVLGCALFTAYGAVRHGADLRGGERVAVVAAGGVGVNVIQIAHAFGASQIIAIDVSDDKLEIARRVGATDAINAKTTNAADRVRELTDGRGVDIAFEVLGGRRRSRWRSRSPATGAAWSPSASRLARPLPRSRSRASFAAACGSSVRTVPARAPTCRRSFASPPGARSARKRPSPGAFRSSKPTPPTRRSTAAKFSAGPSS